MEKKRAYIKFYKRILHTYKSRWLPLTKKVSKLILPIGCRMMLLDYNLFYSGNFCSMRTGLPKDFAAGTYMNETQAEKCFDCPPRFFCTNRINPEPCSAGVFLSFFLKAKLKPFLF